MDADAQNWYAHIAGAVNELRTDFRRMSANRLPPSVFGIRVRSHPDTLIVTAQNKMRNSQEVEHSVSFSAFNAETSFLPKSVELNQQNVDRVRAFVNLVGPAELEGNRYVWKGRGKREIAALLSGLNISNMNMEFLPNANDGSRPLLQFIEENSIPELQNWDVCIPQGQGKEVPEFRLQITGSKSQSVVCRKRQFEKTAEGAAYLKLNKQRVGDASDEKVGMTDQQLEKVKEEWETERLMNERGNSIPGYMYRRFRSRPLLTIHFIECTGPNVSAKNPERMMRPEDVEPEVIVAVSLSFPDFDPSGTQRRVAYRLNKIALNDLFGQDQDDYEDTD